METDTTKQIPTEIADRIAADVLTGRYLKSYGGLDLVRTCACRYGRCGHCDMGRHDKCTTRVGFDGKPPARPLTHVVGRSSGALAGVWPSGTACRWVCPCRDCASGSRPEQTAPAVAYRRARGDLLPGDTVWLRPKTLACPAICWKQPRATVVAASANALYVVVKVGRKQYRIHVDNIRRTNPAASHGVVHVNPRPAMPDGFEEMSLF